LHGILLFGVFVNLVKVKGNTLQETPSCLRHSRAVPHQV